MEDFQQGWKQKRAAVEGHRSKELREHPQSANEGSRQRAAGRASRTKGPERGGGTEGRQRRYKGACDGAMPGWDARQVQRREGEREG